MYASAPSSPSSMTRAPACTVIISNVATSAFSASAGSALNSGSGATSGSIESGDSSK